MRIIVYLVIVNLYHVACEETTSTTVDSNGTTATMAFAATTIPETDVDEAINIDVSGTYSTYLFNYENDYLVTRRPTYQSIVPQRCYNDWIKCLLSQEDPSPVCGVHDYREYWDGYLTFNSYCDLYLDNCRRKLRFWYLWDVGTCHTSSKDYIVDQTRRFIKKLFNTFHSYLWR